MTTESATTDYLTQTWWLTHRKLTALAKQPAVLVITLVQPVIWLFLFGELFKKIVELPGFGATSYLDYLVPGVVIMNAVSSNMWAGMGTIDEIDRGTLNRFLVTPVGRGAIVNANVDRAGRQHVDPVGDHHRARGLGRRALPGRRSAA